MATEEGKKRKDLERVNRRSSHSNGKPKNRFRLLDLPEELIAQILGELPRFDYLNFLTSGRSETHRIYFQDRVEIALATEGGYVESTRDDAFNELGLLLNGWNATEYPDIEVNHRTVREINSCSNRPGSLLAPTFITDGFVRNYLLTYACLLFIRSTILFGSGFKERNLVIFDIATTTCVTISPTELRQIGFPHIEFRNAHFHSGLLIVINYRGLFCFKLEGMTLARLELPKETPQLGNITINKEFVCGIMWGDGYQEILLYSRDFVLKGKIMFNDHLVTELYIRDKTIIGLTNKDRSIEFWHFDETDKCVQTSIKHIKSIPINGIESSIYDNIFPEGRLPLSLSLNINTMILFNDDSFYSNDGRFARFASFETCFPWTVSGCVDRIASQYFAEIEVVYQPTRIVVTFQISNIRLLNVKREIKIWLPLTLEEILGCEMFFSTIVLFFTSGVARLRLKNHESLSRKVAYNSSGVVVSTRGTKMPERYRDSRRDW